MCCRYACSGCLTCLAEALSQLSVESTVICGRARLLPPQSSARTPCRCSVISLCQAGGFSNERMQSLRGRPDGPGRLYNSAGALPRFSASLLVGVGRIHPPMVDGPHPPLFHQRARVLSLVPRSASVIGPGQDRPSSSSAGERRAVHRPASSRRFQLRRRPRPREVGPAVSPRLRGQTPLVSLLLLPASAPAAGPVSSAQRCHQDSGVGPPCVVTFTPGFSTSRGSREVGPSAPPRLRGRTP
ncbi:hypothetical protein NDU88_004018 [Pleurodeles waltl]|uniref:Uncharacterized protein n=1 Tax=Pleurodeles waltl TaxID=8319 RepID=A0AAV7L5I0_PLEWA|nr:hypothetical protein NDU88_004018 [Pleurodeles waltl]